MLAVNAGSGQRPFDQKEGWVNVDCIVRFPEQVPDVVCIAESLPFPSDTMDLCVLHHVYEHFGLGEGHGVVREANRVLRRGGSLIITVPDMRALAQRWLTHGITDYIYFVNVYGAYQGSEHDRHKWGYTAHSLSKDLRSIPGAAWRDVRMFDWRHIPGALIARDFWILGIELIK